MTSERPQAPGGWYPDPSGRFRQRWWTGAHWTPLVLSNKLQVLQERPDPEDQGRAIEGRALSAATLLARSRELHAIASNIATHPDRTRERVAGKIRAVREPLVQVRLAAVTVERLRETADGRIRITALATAGYRTAADLASASQADLEHIPGVGVQTAAQAIAAARQLRSAIEQSIPLRLTPDRPDANQTELLAALRALDASNQTASPLARLSAALEARIGGLLAHLTPPIGWGTPNSAVFATGRRAHSAWSGLDALLNNPDLIAMEPVLRVAVRVLANEPAADELWRDYELRASDYQALLAEFCDGDLDVAASQGFLPQEVAARVNEQQLDDTFMRASLRGYQAFGAKFALVQHRTIVGDEMGLGKTIEALAAMAHLQSIGGTHYLVVCPASVLLNWIREIQCRSALRCHRLHGGERWGNLRRWVRDGGVAVTTYDTLSSFSRPEDLNLAMLVIDEAHYIKNPQTLRSLAVQQWIEGDHRTVFLTGTPMENRLDEFKNLVRYLQPEVSERIQEVTGLAGATAFQSAVATVYLRRNQTDVLTELPERIVVEDWLELSPEDSRAYRAAVASGNFMAMRQAAFRAVSSAKIDRLREIVHDSAASGWKIVIFSFFLEVLERIRVELRDTALGPINGSLGPNARQHLVDAFSSTEGHAVLLSQITAGGIGLNLQAASVVVLAEPQWKPTTEDQAVGRCHRMGQTRPVHVHRLLTRDSVDELMLATLEAKEFVFDTYVRRSAIALTTPEAVDVSDVDTAKGVVSQLEAEREIIARERQRLGIDEVPADRRLLSP